MIVDTSAIVALLLGEPQAGDIAQLLADGPARMSAATLVELHAVAANRLSPVQQRRLERLLVEAQVEIVAFTEEQGLRSPPRRYAISDGQRPPRPTEPRRRLRLRCGRPHHRAAALRRRRLHAHGSGTRPLDCSVAPL